MADPRKKGPKSHKSDGTPKKRWTAAERAARGHDPRRRGGKARKGPERTDRRRTDRPRAAQRRDDWNREDRPRGDWNREDRPRGDRRDADRSPARREHRRGERREDGGNDRRSFASTGERRPSARPESRGGRRGDPRGDDRRRDDRRDFRGKRRDFDGPPPRGQRRRPEREPEVRESVPDQMSWEAAEARQMEITEAMAASGFAELGVALPLVGALATKGITEPFPIQAATIADAVAGRDVLGRARTGSGKTLAFGLPMLTALAEGDSVGSPRAMILTPTRELALQIADELSPLAAAVGLDMVLVAGGMSYGPQIRAFERGVDVVVATPGRLIDLLEQGVADLSQVRVSILDEADHMCDLGFLPDMQTLLDAVPADGQRLLFSATLDDAVARLVRAYLHDPITHEVDSGQASVTTMTHHFLDMAPHHKNGITAEVANRDGRTLVFARTQLGADRIARQLREAGVLAGALHGGMTQGARARVLTAYRGGELNVLVATDVAARGIHVDDITLVLQVDPPLGPKEYLHRAGRTARAGESGAVVSIVLPHQRKQLRRIAGQAGVPVPLLPVAPGSPELRDATGARPTSGTPIAEEDYLAIIAPKPQRRRPRAAAHGDRRGGFRRHGRRRDVR